MAERRSLTTFVLWTAVLAGIAGLSLGLVYGWQLLGARRELQAELDLIEAAGQPTTFAQVAELYPEPPKGKDATALWLEAIAEVDRVRQGELLQNDHVEFYPSPEGVWPDMGHAERLTAKYREPLELFYRAAEHGGAVRYPIDFSAGADAELPHLTPLREAVFLLQRDAALKAHRRDVEGALRAIRAIFAVGKSLENEPVLVSQLVRNACVANGVIAFEKLLPAIEISGDQLHELRELMRSVPSERSLELIILSERTMTIALLLSNDPRGSFDVREGDEEPPESGWRPNRLRDLAFYLKLVRTALAAASIKGPARPKELGLADFEMWKLNWPARDARHPWAARMVTPISSMIDSCLSQEARLLAADAAIAIVLYQRAKGKSPQKLDELVPEYLPAAPMDPFSDEPLRYRITGSQCTVYSLGPNRLDDEGAAFKDMTEPYDVGFSLKNLAPLDETIAD